MSAAFFPEPPRTPGRAFWRRLRGALLWTLCGTAGTVLAITVVSNRFRERSESIRVASAGRTLPCKILDKRRTYGKSPQYFVTLEVTGNIPKTFSRRVDPDPWRDARSGQSTVFYGDPDRPEQGVAQIERSYRERLGDISLLGVGALILAMIAAASIVRRVSQMALLRHGVELVSAGTGREVRISFEGRSTEIRRPQDGWRHVLVRPPRGSRGYVVLASRDLRRAFFPDLRDVTVDRLTRDEEIERVLPAPIRALTPSWKDWVRHKHRGFRIVALFAAAAAAVFLLMAWGLTRDEPDRWSSFLSGAVWAAIPGLAGAVLGLQWLRGYWRDRVLWLEGEEVHAVVLDEKVLKTGVRYEVSYPFNGHEFRRSAFAPLAWEAWAVPSPPTAPAVTDRIVLLVDPYRPGRWTPVPGRCRR